jgi:DNA-binding LacI/PurR family transcriptional regulator
MKKDKRYRIADVAKYAGVSEATVSVVLNNRVGDGIRVSEETQQRVWNAVHKLGYVPNPAARSLARGRNNLIAVFTFESIFPIDSRNFYYPFLVGIEEEAAAQGYDLLLSTAARDPSTHGRIYHQGANRLTLADGAILLGHAADKSEITRLLDDGFPFVYVGRRDSPNDDISYAASDYVDATRQIVDYLLKHQHRDLAYLASSERNESNQDRHKGFVFAHEEHGIALNLSLYWQGEPEAFTKEAFLRLTQQGATAFIAENDQLALRLLGVTAALQRRCPEDFSLAVLGDPLSIVDSGYSWTTFKIPRREMGREAVRLLVQRLSDDQEMPAPPYRTLLPCQFVAGNTVSVAKRE